MLLNRPGGAAGGLRIHRSTVPARVPLAALAARHLGRRAGESLDAAGPAKPARQDLPRLVREVRRELVSYHLRRAAIASLQRAGSALSDKVVVSEDDACARDVRLEWTDGRIGRVRIGAAGGVQKCVVFGRSGRLRRAERALLGGGGAGKARGRIEDLAERLSAVGPDAPGDEGGGQDA